MKDQLPINRNIYINYRNVYNRLIRSCKKEYYADTLAKCRKNPKKTWDTYREILGTSSTSKKINEISVNGSLISDDTCIAEEFNKFFTSVGTDISESITRINVDPMSFMPNLLPRNELNFDKVGPILVCDILKAMDSKKSVDMDGISINLLTFISSNISTP